MDNRGYGIQKICTDQTTEYSYREIHNFQNINGIVHSSTGRATHAQMYVSKRSYRTMV